MKIWKNFNTLTLEEYIFYIDNRKKYTDFNELWLFRSVFENEQLKSEEKITLRDYIIKEMPKVFEFMQVRHPDLYTKLYFLGKTPTKGDENHLWKEISSNQEKILKEKRIKHRNFWNYSKHNCGYDNCHLNWLMIQQWSWFCEDWMRWLPIDTKMWFSKIWKQERKAERNIVNLFLKSEGL